MDSCEDISVEMFEKSGLCFVSSIPSHPKILLDKSIKKQWRTRYSDLVLVTLQTLDPTLTIMQFARAFRARHPQFVEVCGSRG